MIRPNNRIWILVAAIGFSVAAMFAQARRDAIAAGGGPAAARAGGSPMVNAADGPTEIIIIRHAEEPKDGPHLSAEGYARAKALVTLFEHPLVQPTSLWAAKSSKQSSRPVETIEPLSRALEIRIDERFDEQEYKKLAEAILQGPRHAGGIVLISWKRETMSDLARALGVANPPAEWPSEQYDHLWRIRYRNGKATLTDEVQDIKLSGER